MELAPNSFPLFSTSAYVPDLNVILNCEKIEDVDNIQPGTSKEKVRNVAILTPAISRVIYDLLDLSSKNVLFSVIQKLRDMEEVQKTKSTQTINSGPDSEAPIDPDMKNAAANIREETKMAFGDLLLTLWKISFKGDQVSAVLGLPVHDPDKQRHLHQVSGYNGRFEEQNTTFPEDQQSPADMKDWASSMTKVAEACQQEIARKAKKEEHAKDKNKKIWEALPEIQKETILVASTQDDLIKPDSLSDPMLMVLSSGTGAKAQTLFHHILKVSGCIVHLDDGFCVAIKNGLFLSQPTEQRINYYSPAF